MSEKLEIIVGTGHPQPGFDLLAKDFIMTPHIGGSANESRTLAGICISDNLKAHVAVRPLLDQAA